MLSPTIHLTSSFLHATRPAQQVTSTDPHPLHVQRTPSDPPVPNYSLLRTAMHVEGPNNPQLHQTNGRTPRPAIHDHVPARHARYPRAWPCYCTQSLARQATTSIPASHAQCHLQHPRTHQRPALSHRQLTHVSTNCSCCQPTWFQPTTILKTLLIWLYIAMQKASTGGW